MPERPAPDECANCGAAIPRNARACAECGADERTGWHDGEATRYDGLDLPDSAFADDAAAPSPPQRKLHAGIRRYWLVAAALLIASLVLGLVSLR